MAGLLAEALSDLGFEVEIARDAQQARDVVDEFDPDIALLDITLGDGPTGVHLAHALRKTHPEIGLLVLTQHPDAGRASGGIELPPGVGFLRKHLVGDINTLTAAIESVLTNRGDNVRQDVPDQGKPLPLAGQPLRVLELLAKGYDNQGIASRMDLSVKSVERWVKHIYDQLDIQTRGDVNPRVEAARRYISAVGIPERAP